MVVRITGVGPEAENGLLTPLSRRSSADGGIDAAFSNRHAGDQDSAENEILMTQLKAEDLESILKLKRKQEGLINPEFGGGLTRNPLLDIPTYEEVISGIELKIELKIRIESSLSLSPS